MKILEFLSFSRKKPTSTRGSQPNSAEEISDVRSNVTEVLRRQECADRYLKNPNLETFQALKAAMKQDTETLRELKNASGGNRRAQLIVAQMYLHGDDPLPKDAESACAWLLRSALQGYREAQFFLGTYLAGIGEYQRAYPWLAIAAESPEELAFLRSIQLRLWSKGWTDDRLAQMVDAVREENRTYAQASEEGRERQ